MFKASFIFVAWRSRISSPVTTPTLAGTSESCCSLRVAVTTMVCASFASPASTANTLEALNVLPNTRANPMYMDNRCILDTFIKTSTHTKSLVIYILCHRNHCTSHKLRITHDLRGIYEEHTTISDGLNPLQSRVRIELLCRCWRSTIRSIGH